LGNKVLVDENMALRTKLASTQPPQQSKYKKLFFPISGLKSHSFSINGH
jgi:hypothetical protein